MCTETHVKVTTVGVYGQNRDSSHKKPKLSRIPNRIYAKASTVDGKPKSFHAIQDGKEWARNYKPEDGESTKYYNQSDMESLCVSKFRRGKRRLEDIYDTHSLFADVDGKGDVNRILAACDMIGLPKEWLTIIITSEGRFHIFIPLKIGLRLNQESLFRLLQRQLNEFLRACGCVTDEGIIFDRLRMLSNPKAVNARNYKYEDAPLKRVIQKGNGKATGSALYKIFKACGWGKEQNKPQKKNIPLAHSIRVTREYIHKRVSVECTQKELADRLGIPLRTLELVLRILKKHKEVEWQIKGNNKGGNRRRCIIHSLVKLTVSSEPHKKNLLKDTGEKGFKYIYNRGLVLEKYKEKVVEIGERDKFFFAATLELIYFRSFERDAEKIIKFLTDNYDIEELGKTFREKEMLSCIKSAMNPKYVRPVSREKLSAPVWGLIPLETQKSHAGVNGKKEFKENLEVY